MSDFNTLFDGAASELQRTFGASSTLITANGAETAIAAAIWDHSSLTATWDVLDDNGQRLDAHALVTLPTSATVDIETCKIRDSNGREYWFLGVTLEGSSLTTYAVGRTQHSRVKKIVLQRRAKG